MSVFIVAEISCSHEGNRHNALKLIRAAARAGADAVKFQLWMTADDMAPPSTDPRFVLPSGPWQGRSLHALYTQAHTPPEWFPSLFQAATDYGVEAFVSPFSVAAVDYLEGLGCPRYKIASPEVPWLALAERLAQTGKPVIVSTGGASEAEIDAVTETLTYYPDALVSGYALLHCVSAYPAPPEHMNLRRIQDLAARYQCPVGLSDHSRGSTAAIAAVALGAVVLEKHIMLAWPNSSLDASFALEEYEFRVFVTRVREAESMLAEQVGANPAERGMCRRRLIDGQWIRSVQ